MGWLLATAAPADEAAARDALHRAVDRHSSLVVQRLAAERGSMTATCWRP